MTMLQPTVSRSTHVDLVLKGTILPIEIIDIVHNVTYPFNIP